MEFGVDDMKEMGFFGWRTPAAEITAAVQRAARGAGFGGPAGPSTGVLLKVTDGNKTPYPGCLEFSSPSFAADLRAKLEADAALGAEYVTFQIFLPDRHLNCGGEYRRDEAFLRQTAARIAAMQRVCARARACWRRTCTLLY